ncbi:glycine cleavage system protein R [Algisphaera agarilytica]|uniref:Glycine cleavage system regulatory protein n=1 Tax=Algisphaera agarilytica TaxID=1385975 RepID=A0A7X0LM97_9BACT|nr:ACT domain-containing protein [Algisphaera agarilytica]MBB6431416.1 glycine cleavage system regulatory protein [Algisphaera agarilytica]
MTSLILTVVGPDRPGLVKALSDVVARHDANWLEGEMAQLAGQFAGIVHVQAPIESVEALSADLDGLKAQKLYVHVTHSPEADSADLRGTRLYELELIGLDRPGIVRDLAKALATRSINVAKLKTLTESAPMSGELMFKATASLHAPEDTSHDDLHDALDQLADDLDLDLSLNVATPQAG